MGLPVKKLDSGFCWVAEMRLSGDETKNDAFLPTASVSFLGLTLVILQIADGYLTSMGISRFGMASEGNPVLRSLMEQFGHIPTLAILKLLAVAIVIGLVFSARSVPWVKGALGAIAAVYFFAAVVPWTYLLFVRPIILG